jgi:hypothetical protein
MTAKKPNSPNVIGPRETLERSAEARCLDCGAFREDNWALAWAVDHVKTTGHVVDGNYWASYRYVPRVVR